MEHGIPFISKGTELSEEVLVEQEKKFMKVLDEIMEKSKEYDVTIRVIGSIAFRIKCPDYKEIEYRNQRYLTDIDFIAYKKEIVEVQDLFLDMGWTENQNVLRLFGDKRRIFYHPDQPIHSDVFIDKLRFCHDVDFRGRLDIDYPTISLVDLILEKLQIVEINKKDLVDVMLLLMQHPISEDGSDPKKIDGAYLAKVLSKDWGFWKTATMNLEKLENFTEDYLEKDERKEVLSKLDTLQRLIDKKKKSIGWKLRSKIGERIKWYREVEEVQRD